MKEDLSKQVEAILAIYPKARNSDIELTIQLWKTYYPELIHNRSDNQEEAENFIFIRDLFDLPREDNIKRIRAKIQNEERRYLPTDINILIERAKQSEEWKGLLGYNNSWVERNWQEALQTYLTAKQEEIRF